MEQKRKRILWADSAKGFATIMVLLWHVPENPEIIKMLYAPFFMPLFFFISGYFHNINYDFRSFLTNKIFGLVVPFLIWTFINSFTYSNGILNVYGSTFIDNLICILRQDNGKNDDLWFLCCLLVAQILLYAILKANSKRYLFISFILALSTLLAKIFFTFSSYWHLDVAAVMQFYMALGFYCKNNNLMERILSNKYFYILPFIYIALTYWDFTFYHFHYDVHVSKYNNPIIFFGLSILGILSCIIISNMFRKSSFINFFGQNSLIFYTFQINALYIYYRYVGGRILRHVTDDPCILFFIEIGFITSACTMVSFIINRYLPIAAGKYRYTINKNHNRR